MIATALPFSLFSNCCLTKGVSRSTIVDLQRENVHLIPNSLFDLLNNFKGKSLSAIKEKFSKEDGLVIDEYVDFLNAHELIHFSDKLEYFPNLSLDFCSSTIVQDCLVDYNSLPNDINYILSQLDELLVSFINIRVFEEYKLESLIPLLKCFDNTTIIGVEILLPWNSLVSDEELKSVIDSSKRVYKVLVHSAQSDKLIESSRLSTPMIFTTKQILSPSCCGIVNTEYFTASLRHFTESQHHNTCLNRKISIDVDGNIKNCPSMAKSYGNIRDTKLIDVVNNPEFQKVWHIKKDEITKCKDCEFRHVCTDCRAYLDNPDDLYSAPLKCGYNPYTCEWEEWSTNPLKQQAIEFYGMQELVKKP